MAVVRCPRCGKAFERTPHQAQVCPNCGLRAPVAEATERIMPEEVVGKPRRAWLAFLLTLVVQPVFLPLYLLLTFRGLDRQHGRQHPIGWWVPACVPVLGIFLSAPYAAIGLSRLKRSRRARGLRQGIGWLTYALVGLLAPLATLGYLVYVLGTGNDMEASFATANLGSDPALETLQALEVWQYAALAAGLLLPPAVAIAAVTASANSLWRAIYAERGEAWPWREPAADAESVAP